MFDIPAEFPRAWFWKVEGVPGFWSAEVGAYVAELPGGWSTDGEGHRPTRIATAQELTDVLAAQGLPGPVVDLADHAAEKRRALVKGSVLVNLGSRTISTWVDPESRGAATGLVVASTYAPDMTAPWKGADGQFYMLDAAEITALAMGMMAFVQACFACEASVLAGIAGGTITSKAAIDAAAWPA